MKKVTFWSKKSQNWTPNWTPNLASNFDLKSSQFEGPFPAQKLLTNFSKKQLTNRKMKKKIHTHCKSQKCGKKLPFPSTSVHFCRNNNKCKNDYHNDIRKAKTDLADQILESTLEYSELQRKLNILLDKRRIRIIPLQQVELMGIDLSSPLLKLVHADSEQSELIEFEFSSFQLLYLCMTDEVVFWRKKVAG